MGKRQRKAAEKRLENMRMLPVLHSPEEYLTEWWGECQTCRFWDTPDLRSLEAHPCTSTTSPLSGEQVYTWGYCQQWDPRWADLAFELLEKWEGPIRGADV